MRLAVVATHPIQYHAPVFRALAKRVDLKVFFCWDFGVKETFDPQFDRTLQWDVPLLDGYEHEFVPNVATDPGVHRFFGLRNPALRERIELFGPDVVMFNGYNRWSMLATLLRLRWRNVPIMMRGDSTVLGKRPLAIAAVKRLLLPLLFGQFAAAAAAGSANRDYYIRFGVKPDRIFLAPYCVSNEFFQNARAAAIAKAAALRRQLRIPEDHRIVLYAGKLIDLKGCDDLIRAFAAVHRGRSTLVIVGDGPRRAHLESLAASTGAPVQFLGFFNQTDMPSAYALAQLFVLPSLSENWGLVVNEAMNFALPIIVSDQVGAAPDLVDTTNGWIYRAGDVGGLSAALEAALTTPTLHEMGARSLERIDRWGISQCVDGLIEAAEFAARSHRPARPDAVPARRKASSEELV